MTCCNVCNETWWDLGGALCSCVPSNVHLLQMSCHTGHTCYPSVLLKWLLRSLLQSLCSHWDGYSFCDLPACSWWRSSWGIHRRKNSLGFLCDIFCSASIGNLHKLPCHKIWANVGLKSQKYVFEHFSSEIVLSRDGEWVGGWLLVVLKSFPIFVYATGE